MAWLLARQRFIEYLELDIRHASWLEPAGTIIILLAFSLKSLKLKTSGIISESGGSTTWMLAPLQNATHLEQLIVYTSYIPDAGFRQPSLRKLSKLRRLELVVVAPSPPTALSSLSVLTCLMTYFSAQPAWAAELSKITQLKSLGLCCSANSPEMPADALEFLTALSGLGALTLWRTSLSRLPAAVTQMSQLTCLQLLDNAFTTPSSLDDLSQLAALKRLVLRNCGLSALPRQLVALTGLERLELDGNPDLALTATDVTGVLASLSALTLLKLARTRAAGINDWMALQLALPQLRLVEV